MPLSEHERRQLEQIEQALRADDPRFADAVRAADPQVHYKRRVIAAALGFLIGVGLLLAGVVINVILIAVAGLCGHAGLQPVDGDKLPAHDRHHHRTRPRQEQGFGHGPARRQGPAGWQAGGIGADGAAGGALAASPGRRPLTQGCPPRPPRLDASSRTGRAGDRTQIIVLARAVPPYCGLMPLDIGAPVRGRLRGAQPAMSGRVFRARAALEPSAWLVPGLRGGGVPEARVATGRL